MTICNLHELCNAIFQPVAVDHVPKESEEEDEESDEEGDEKAYILTGNALDEPSDCRNSKTRAVPDCVDEGAKQRSTNPVH